MFNETCRCGGLSSPAQRKKDEVWKTTYHNEDGHSDDTRRPRRRENPITEPLLALVLHAVYNTSRDRSFTHYICAVMKPKSVENMRERRIVEVSGWVRDAMFDAGDSASASVALGGTAVACGTPPIPVPVAV